MHLLPIPPAVKRTLLRCIENEEYEWGKHSDIDDARNWLNDLARQWPAMPNLEGGKDMFSQYPVAGE